MPIWTEPVEYQALRQTKAGLLLIWIAVVFTQTLPSNLNICSLQWAVTSSLVGETQLICCVRKWCPTACQALKMQLSCTKLGSWGWQKIVKCQMCRVWANLGSDHFSKNCILLHQYLDIFRCRNPASTINSGNARSTVTNWQDPVIPDHILFFQSTVTPENYIVLFFEFLAICSQMNACCQ